MFEPAPPNLPVLRPGTVLEKKWLLIRKLGQGGMGAVFLARDVQLERQVAIKVFWDERGLHPETLERFDREAKLLASIDNLHVVPIYAFGRHEGYPFLVMKALEGATLSAVRRKHGGRMNWRLAGPIVQQNLRRARIPALTQRPPPRPQALQHLRRS